MPQPKQLAVLLFCFAGSLAAQRLVVDRTQDRHAINPLIYGINFYWRGPEASTPAASGIRATTRRWGGNNTSRYNWKLDIRNLASDWYFEVLPDNTTDVAKLPGGSSFNKMVDEARATGGVAMGTVPILDWTPRSRTRMCSFSVARYGPQCKTDPYWADCGNGQKTDCKTNIVNDPTEVHEAHDESFARDWVQYVVGRYGRANEGGVAMWSLDNEPVWWSATHRDIHPKAQEYDETAERGIRYARAIKQADPTALVTGPVSAGWESMFFSLKDCNAGWGSRGVNGGADWKYWNNPVDRRAHGGVAFVPWYLQQFREAERREGVRMLDVLDLHAYVAPDGIPFSRRGNEATEKLRLTSTRVFWDPEFKAPWLPNVDDLNSPEYGKPVAAAMVPRMKRWVEENYPGLQTAITEYHWGAAESITGAVAQADILGIFGREGLDIATLWGPSTPSDPLAFAFKIFRNYDGQGGTFGETSVRAKAVNADEVAIFAAERSDGALTVLLLNKTSTSQPVELETGASGPAQLWRYSEANLRAIVSGGEQRLEGGFWQGVLPAYSLNLLVIAPSYEDGTVPVIENITDAASRRHGPVAPGQELLLTGTGFGLPEDAELEAVPVTEAGLAPLEHNGMRVLVDGVPAPILAHGGRALRIAAPFFLQVPAAVGVQLELRGARSGPVVIQTARQNPALFTMDGSGVGQARARNAATGEWNGAEAPAAAGSLLMLEGSGGGATDPGGVDGRKAGEIVAKLVASCRAFVGDLEAKVEECTEAPGEFAGRFRISVRLPEGVPSGSEVPLRIQVGAGQSQPSVTIAVR